jgi:type 1 glutamine amidotransferase
MLSRRDFGKGILAVGLGMGARSAAAQAPVRVLLVLVGGGPHDVEKNPPYLEKALQTAGGFQVTRLAPPVGQQTDGAHLAKLADIKPGDYDVLAFYTAGQNLTPEAETALKGFVEAGGGLVGIHGASFSFGKSEVWFRMIGARFAGHAAGLFPLTVTPTEPDHPIMKGVTEFQITDEEYTHRFADGVERHVLARFKERPANTVEKNGNNDVLWTINEGKGRVVYTCLGHGADAWQNPMWQKMVAQSLCWAAHKPREVKIG